MTASFSAGSHRKAAWPTRIQRPGKSHARGPGTGSFPAWGGCRSGGGPLRSGVRDDPQASSGRWIHSAGSMQPALARRMVRHSCSCRPGGDPVDEGRHLPVASMRAEHDRSAEGVVSQLVTVAIVRCASLPQPECRRPPARAVSFRTKTKKAVDVAVRGRPRRDGERLHADAIKPLPHSR